MTEDDCSRVLALWGLTDIEQAVDCADWPWHRNLLSNRSDSAVCVAKHARMPDFTKYDAAAVQLLVKMAQRIRPQNESVEFTVTGNSTGASFAIGYPSMAPNAPRGTVWGDYGGPTLGAALLDALRAGDE